MAEHASRPYNGTIIDQRWRRLRGEDPYAPISKGRSALISIPILGLAGFALAGGIAKGLLSLDSFAPRSDKPGASAPEKAGPPPKVDVMKPKGPGAVALEVAKKKGLLVAELDCDAPKSDPNRFAGRFKKIDILRLKFAGYQTDIRVERGADSPNLTPAIGEGGNTKRVDPEDLGIESSHDSAVAFVDPTNGSVELDTSLHATAWANKNQKDQDGALNFSVVCYTVGATAVATQTS